MDTYQHLFVQERLDLCALLASLSSQEWHAATLDEGWTVADLAAHMVVREHHGRALLRALLLRDRGRVEALMAREKAGGPDALRASLRTMPPLVFRLPGVVARGNLCEAYIHNEDVRRGALQRLRVVSADTQAALWASLPLVARGLRRVPACGTLALVWPERAQRVVAVGRGRRRDAAALRGEPGELLLWLSGRKAAARVQVDGADALVTALRDAPLGI